MSLGFLLFVACGLTFIGAFGMGISDAGGKGTQLDPGHGPVKFEFRVNYDPGHGGSSMTYTLERRGGKFLVDISKINPLEPPQRPTKLPLPRKKEPAPEERAPEEAEQFLGLLVNDIKIGEMKDLKTPFFLHPTIYDFEITYANGRVHRFEYMIEIDHHLDERYRRLVNECEKFFGIK